MSECYGYKSTRVYHTHECGMFVDLSDALEVFNSPLEAKIAGYRLCKRCARLGPTDTFSNFIRGLLGLKRKEISIIQISDSNLYYEYEDYRKYFIVRNSSVFPQFKDCDRYKELQVTSKEEKILSNIAFEPPVVPKYIKFLEAFRNGNIGINLELFEIITLEPKKKESRNVTKHQKKLSSMYVDDKTEKIAIINNGSKLDKLQEQNVNKETEYNATNENLTIKHSKSPLVFKILFIILKFINITVAAIFLIIIAISFGMIAYIFSPSKIRKLWKLVFTNIKNIYKQHLNII